MRVGIASWHGQVSPPRLREPTEHQVEVDRFGDALLRRSYNFNDLSMGSAIVSSLFVRP
jgi:hypothetical protein